MNIIISKEEIEKYGIREASLTFSELLSIIDRKLNDASNIMSESVERYDQTKSYSGEKTMKARKKNIIQSIDRINNDIVLRRLEKLLNEIAFSAKSSLDVFKPSKHDISVAEMVKIQNYHGIDAKVFERITAEMDISEPLDELLKSV